MDLGDHAKQPHLCDDAKHDHGSNNIDPSLQLLSKVPTQAAAMPIIHKWSANGMYFFFFFGFFRT